MPGSLSSSAPYSSTPVPSLPVGRLHEIPNSISQVMHLLGQEAPNSKAHLLEFCCSVFSETSLLEKGGSPYARGFL